MPGGTAHRDDRVQDAAGALGQGPDPMRQERLAQGVARQCLAAREDGSLVSLDRQYQLSADDRAQHAAAAGHDYSFLSGLVPDGLHRSAPVSGFHVFDLKFLPRLAKRTVSPNLVSHDLVPAAPDGAG